MPFDFDRNPLNLYGIFPQTPFPVELSLYGHCSCMCSYCFANLNRRANERELNLDNTTQVVFRKIDRCLQDEYSPIGFFLRERYPIAFSNRTDPFQRAEATYRSTEAFLAWAKSFRLPIYLMTRGNVLYAEWERYAPLLEPGRVVAYISICQLDDKLRKRHEPGALPLPQRWELVRRLTDHGIPVVVAANPWVRDWLPEPEPLCAKAAECGAVGAWWEALHLTGAQADVLPLTYRGELLTQANTLPMYVIGVLKRWYAATEAAGLDFFPTPKWDGYFGHKAKHPECADPQWLGGKTLDFNFRLLKSVSRLSAENGNAMVLFGWPEVRACLESLGVPNPILDTAPFWYCHNATQNGDYRAFRARLGKRCPLYEIVRFMFGRPWESQNLVWYHPLVQAVFNHVGGDYTVDAEGDLVAAFNPAIKHHGDFTLSHDSIDWDRVLWPRFGAAAEVAVPVES